MKMNVLVVDDERMFLQSLVEGVGKLAPELGIITASNGLEALERLEQEPVHMVITDVNMPLMDGLELLVHLSNERPKMPVAIMTAYGTPELHKKATHGGALRVLEKPVSIQTLLEAIRRGLDAPSPNEAQGIQGISLVAFLQMLQHERKSLALAITSQHGVRGLIHLSVGEVVDAECASLSSLDAVLEMLCWESTRLEMLRVQSARPRTLQVRVDFLLLEAARLKDEGQLPRHEHPPAAPMFEEPEFISWQDEDLDVAVISASAALTARVPANDGSASLAGPIELLPKAAAQQTVELPTGARAPVRAAPSASPPSNNLLPKGVPMGSSSPSNIWPSVLESSDILSFARVPRTGGPPTGTMNKGGIERARYFARLAELLGQEMGLQRCTELTVVGATRVLLVLEDTQRTTFAEAVAGTDVVALARAVQEEP